ncbi:MAG: M56 family metallopeptidase [Eubacteriales bacterium]
MTDIFQFFLSNSVVASGFFLLLLLTKPLTEKYFSQSWHYLALRVNALLFFIPITPICEKIAPFLVGILPTRTKTEVMIPQTESATWFIPVEDFTAMGEIGGTVGADLAMTAEGNPLNWTEIFLLLWVIGSTISLIWHCYCRIRLQKELKPLIPLENPEIHAKLEQCKVEKKINARIKLFSSHKLYSPLLVGLFQGKILFPNKKMEEKHLEYIFSHELTHFKRGDLWWKALLTPISVIFWWNPLIYYFMAQFELRLEYSCDEKVVGKSSIKERKSYGLAILESIDEKKQEKIKLFGVSLRTPEQKLETRLIKMLKFSEMKTRTKVLSGVLMSAMLLGAAAPSMANVLSEPKIIYDDPWDMPAKTGSPINTLVSVNSEDEKNFTEEEWAEIMQRVEAGTIEYVEITDEHRELEALLKKHNIPPFMTSAPNELPLPSLTVGEKLELFQYYVENNCTGSLHCHGDLNETTGEYEITISCYNSEGDMIVSHDLGTTWEVKDHIMGGSSRILDDMKLSGQALDIIPSIVETSAFLVEGTDNGEDYGGILAESENIQSFDLKIIAVSPEDEKKFTPEQWADILEKVDAGEIQMLEEGSQGIEIVPVDVEDDSTAREEVKRDFYYIESAETQFYSQINSLRDADYYISDSSNGITYFATEEGTNIYPYGKGTVIESGFEINAGNQVVILHEDGSKTQYRHCKELFVSVGDEVGLEDVLGTVGRTGNVTGFALGFALYQG